MEKAPPGANGAFEAEEPLEPLLAPETGSGGARRHSRAYLTNLTNQSKASLDAKTAARLRRR